MVGNYMKSHPAFIELITKLKYEDQLMLQKWIDRWFVELIHKQSIVNKKFIDSPYDQFIKENIAHRLIDQSLEESINFDIGANSYTANIITIRRTPHE